MPRSQRSGLGLLIILALVVTASLAQAAPRVATIEVKGMV
jgi:hypothetical protein